MISPPQSIERHIPQTLSRPLQAAGSLLYTFSDSMYLDYFFTRVYRFNFGLSTSSCPAGSDVFLYRFGRTLTSEPVRYAALAYASLLRNRKVEVTTLEYLGSSYSYLHKAISASQYEDATYACYILFLRFVHGWLLERGEKKRFSMLWDSSRIARS